MAVSAKEIRIGGVVQGVGFRPFVFTLAETCNLSGWVCNDSRGVLIHAEGESADLDRFVELLPTRAPTMSKIELFAPKDVPLEGFESFGIRQSRREEGERTLISPDVATCPDCEAELFDEADRRYHYPFINCTNCGPRFTIIDDIPYDRPSTSMRDFPMCDECAAEYANPRDRRFHAQPDACFVCGPRLYLREDDVADSSHTSDTRATGTRDEIITSERTRSDEIIARTSALLKDGKVVAIKGLGGYHLACDATNEDAVRALRDRKHRYGKPLAIMVASCADAEAYCSMNSLEKTVLADVVRPIVLLRRNVRQGVLRGALGATKETTGSAGKRTEPRGYPAGVLPSLANGVAGDLPEIGVMLPYTPLQHLLLRAFDGPLVMTSGNISGEPIETNDESAYRRLSGIADAFLSNDREILSRYDDSVVRIVGGEMMMVRRARGYAPFPLTLPSDLQDGPAVLGAGPEQKNTFTLSEGKHAFVSQHIGDLESAATMKSWEDTLQLYSRLFRISPEIIACDLHPEYLATKWAHQHAAAHGLPLVEVQHHHAHIAGVAAEHGLTQRITGIAFDGTGYGSDGTIWGGEVLLANRADFRRFAHLDTFELPGGAAAIRRPARTALALLAKHDLLNHPGAQALLSRLAQDEYQTVLRMIENHINTPLTSSMGRLFDAVSSLIGVSDDAAYEGSPAIELEANIDPQEQATYEFFVREDESTHTATIEHRTVILGILDDLAAGVPTPRIAAKFHHAVAHLILSLAKLGTREVADPHVALAGGVFMNRFLLEETLALLKEHSFIPLTPKGLPVNDGAVSYGQAIVALARHAKTG